MFDRRYLGRVVVGSRKARHGSGHCLHHSVNPYSVLTLVFDSRNAKRVVVGSINATGAVTGSNIMLWVVIGSSTMMMLVTAVQEQSAR